MKPAVITSKTAAKDFEHIKASHAAIVDGIAQQSQKVQTMRQQNAQQKAAEMQNKQTMETEMKKAQMTADSAAQKNAQDFAIRQGELDVKRAALSQI